MQNADPLRKFNEQNKAGQICSRGLRLWQKRGGHPYWVMPEAGDSSDILAEFSLTKTSNHWGAISQWTCWRRPEWSLRKRLLRFKHGATLAPHCQNGSPDDASLIEDKHQAAKNQCAKIGVSVSNFQQHPDATAVTPSKRSDDKATHEGFNNFLLKETQSG